MPVYKCLMLGENFELDDLNGDGEPTLNGFYATRWVSALNSQRAELKAVQMLRDELKPSLKDKSELTIDAIARVYLEENEVVKVKPLRRKNKGASWFKMEKEK